MNEFKTKEPVQEELVPQGHFWRGNNNPEICKNCGQLYSAHIFTDEASRCPGLTGKKQ